MQKYKRGYKREDGMVFFFYTNQGKEYWVDEKLFHSLTEKEKIRHRNRKRKKINLNKKDKKFKFGDIRSDGFIFLRYSNTCKNGEYWVSEATFQKYKCNVEKRKKSKKYKDVRNASRKFRKKTDLLFNIKENIKSSIASLFKKSSKNKIKSTEAILGCSFIDFKSHIESQFLEGMSWQNRGEWHIDHIIPISLAKTEEQLIYLNHHTNLRPMWAIQNIKKSNKIFLENKKKYDDFKKTFDIVIK